MVSVTIDGVSVGVEQGVEWLDDGTEEYDLGTLLITNTAKSTPYTDYDTIVIVSNGETFTGCLRQDLVQRMSVGKHQHSIKVAELALKLSAYPHPDRLYTTKGGLKTTYKIHLEELIASAFYGKTSPLTVASATLAFFDVDADEKEYSGGDLFKSIVDLMRTQGAVLTLSSSNVIGHNLIRRDGSLISFDRIDGQIITSDINDYAMKVYSKVKKATYEANLITGGTFYPDKNTGVTVRSSETKYADADAQYIIDSGIRRMIDARGKNITTNSIGTQTNLLIKIVSKEEWDDLELNREYASATPGASVYEGTYKNNTPYFIEDDNVIYNIGTEYEYNGWVIGQPRDALNQAIRRGLVASGESETEFKTQTIKDVEIVFYYQPIRDMDIVQERHDLERVGKISTITNQQKDSKLELARFGNANKQLINRMGNDTKQITVRYYDKNTPTYFQIGDYTSDGYAIIKRQFLFRGSSQDITYLLTKNQSILNPNTSVKRNFVSPFTISKRNILTNFVYEEYIEFSATRKTDTSSQLVLREILFNGLSYDAAYDKSMYNCQYRRGASDFINMSVMSIPMGSSFEFNAQFNHPKFAGYQLVSDTVGTKLKPVSYGDANGEVDTARFYFMHSSTINSDLHPVGSWNTNWNFEIGAVNIGLNPDEILGMTAVKHCITDDKNLIVGDYFLQNNSIIKELGGAQGISLVYYDDNPRYNTGDIYAKTWDGTVSYTLDTGGYEFFSVVNVPADKSWALIETAAPNRIYFAYNNTGTDIDRVYMNLLKDRPNTETL